MSLDPQLLNLTLNVIQLLLFVLVVIGVFQFMVRPNLPADWSTYTKHSGKVYFVLILLSVYGGFQTSGPKLTLDVNHQHREAQGPGEITNLKPKSMLDRDRTDENRRLINENSISE